jgi:[CysO sulfur-carrier protein]-S-L-cysteine hydrolase
MRDLEKHPWATGNLAIERAVLEAVFDEARKAYGRDEESCGLLVGPEGDGRRLDDLVPMVNRANRLHAIDPVAYPRTGRMYFDIDSMKFETALRSGESQGRPVKVLYHSHLDVGAYFSATDAEVAKMGRTEPPWDLAYLVTSVRQGKVDDHKLFVWEPGSGTFVESRLEILETTTEASSVQERP